MRWLVLLVVLSACGTTLLRPGASGSTAAPEAVTLYRDTLVVEMRDGAVCTGVREGRTSSWATRLAGCPHTWPVAVERPTSLARQPLFPADTDPWVTIAPPDRPALGFGPRPGS